MILGKASNTEEKEADLAIFLTPVTGILAKLSSIAFVLVSLMTVIELLPLWRVIKRGPAWESLF